MIVIPQVFSQFDTISLRDCQLSGSENDDTYALDLSTANLTDLSLIFKKNDFFNYGVSSQGSTRTHRSGSNTLPRRRLFLQVNMVGQQTYMHFVFDDSTNTTMAVSRNDFKKKSTLFEVNKRGFIYCYSCQVAILGKFQLKNTISTYGA